MDQAVVDRIMRETALKEIAEAKARRIEAEQTSEHLHVAQRIERH